MLSREGPPCLRSNRPRDTQASSKHRVPLREACRPRATSAPSKPGLFWSRSNTRILEAVNKACMSRRKKEKIEEKLLNSSKKVTENFMGMQCVQMVCLYYTFEALNPSISSMIRFRSSVCTFSITRFIGPLLVTGGTALPAADMFSWPSEHFDKLLTNAQELSSGAL